MKTLKITYYEILRYIRDWKAIVLLLAAPLLTIAITGNATYNTDKNRMVEKSAVAFYSADSGQLSQQLEKLLQSPEVKNSFDITRVESRDEGYAKVKSGKVEAFIYIPKNLSSDFSKGIKTSIPVYSGKEISAARFLVEGFTNQINMASALEGMGRQNITASKDFLKQEAVSLTEKSPNGLDRWTYLNMTLFLFYGALLGSISVINNNKKKTKLRMDTAPISRFANVTGIFIGNTAISFICTIIIIFVSKYCFGTNWDGNILAILFTFLLFAAISNSFGIMLGYATKNTAVSILIICCVNIFLGNIGVSSAIDGAIPFPEWMMLISPHYYVYKAVSNSVFNGPVSDVTSSVVSLVIIAAVAVSAMLAAGRRKSI